MLDASWNPVHISSPLARILALTIGGMMLVVTVMIHSFGIRAITAQHNRRYCRIVAESRSLVIDTALLGRTVYLLLLLHCVEVVIWALVLDVANIVPGIHDSVYYAMNAYTTLGFGESLARPEWRNMASLIAISGFFTFAWTGSTLVALASMTSHADRNPSTTSTHKESQLGTLLEK